MEQPTNYEQFLAYQAHEHYLAQRIRDARELYRACRLSKPYCPDELDYHLVNYKAAILQLKAHDNFDYTLTGFVDLYRRDTGMTDITAGSKKVINYRMLVDNYVLHRVDGFVSCRGPYIGKFCLDIAKQSKAAGKRRIWYVRAADIKPALFDWSVVNRDTPPTTG